MVTQEQIKELIEKIVSEYEPEKIYLFGSYADGNVNKDSDIDLLVIKEVNESRTKRIIDLKTRLLKYKFNFPLDLLVYTEEEMRNENLGKFSFIYDVLNNGKVLYER